MNFLTETEGTAILITFGLVMITLVWLRTHAESHLEGFLVADRKVGLLQGATSIAVSWVWAPAIFICSLQAYTLGLPGIFWFTFPNIICFFIFAPIAKRIRDKAPKGYTLPEFILDRFNGDKRVHIAYLVVTLGYQLGAILMNSLAGGALLHIVSGLDIKVAIIGMATIALAYSLLSGLKASVFTDVIQMLMILGLGFILIPLCLIETDGFTTIYQGLGGIDNRRSLFDPWVAFTMGIPLSLTLISGPIIDQMFYQRTMAVEKKNVVKTFVYGGLIFGIVPIILSLLGFIGTTLEAQGLITVSDPQLVGPIVIGYLLPKSALIAFCFMAFAGLCSTMDSAFCAGSGLGTIDIFKTYIKPDANEREKLIFSRCFMLFMAVTGAGIALLQPKLLWMMLILGALASAALFPTILAIFWKKVTAGGLFWGIILSVLIATPLTVYANIKEDPHLIVFAALLAAGIGLFTCALSTLNLNNYKTLKINSATKVLL